MDNYAGNGARADLDRPSTPHDRMASMLREQTSGVQSAVSRLTRTADTLFGQRPQSPTETARATALPEFGGGLGEVEAMIIELSRAHDDLHAVIDRFGPFGA